MKQTQAPTRGTSDARQGIFGLVKAVTKHIFAQVSLRPKIREIRKEVRDIYRAVPAIARDLDFSVTLLSKKIDYLLVKIDAYVDVDDTNHAAMLKDFREHEAALTARLVTIEQSGGELAGALGAMRKEALESRLAAIEKIDAYADVDDTNHAAILKDFREREEALTARLVMIEQSGAELAGALDAIRKEALEARLAAIEKSGAELAGAMAVIRNAGIRGTEEASKSPKDGVAAKRPDRKVDPSYPFIADIEPFLYGAPITYVDVGAYQGTVLDELLNSQVHVFSAHLIEPNPKTFSALEAKLADYTRPSRRMCHNLAVSDAAGVVTMRGENDMTHVLPASKKATSRSGIPSATFEVNAIRLDEFAATYGIDHIALLKVDVEGHELSVFEGARQLLETESIDIIYVEAGVDPNSSQQVYYRAIEDVLRSHGYRLFKIYEQKHEWLDDSPLLRRINMAFMSARFATSNPYRLAHELFGLRTKNRELSEEIGRFKLAAAEQVKLSGESIKRYESEIQGFSDRSGSYPQI